MVELFLFQKGEIMKLGFLMVSFIWAMLFMVGCGGSGGSVTTASSTLNGTVATGIGQIADIVIIDSAGHSVTTVSDENGAFSVTTAGLTQPIMIQATIRSTGNLMYSFASSSRGTLNVTPLTTFIVDQAAVAAGVTGGASQLFQNFAANSSSIAPYISTETTTLNGVISSSMSDFNVSGFNHFSGSFRANHTGYDAFLDSLDIEMQQDDVIIRHGGTTLDTLNYAIQTQEINITGHIVNVSTNAPISGATIQAVDNRGHTISATTDSDGAFIITADTMRNYNVTITANGYITQYIPRVSSFVFTDLQIGTIFMFPNDLSGTTTVSGSVIDARTESTGINGATVTFRSGYNTRVGTAIASATTDSTGAYTIAALAIGNYTVEVAKSGFATRYLNMTVSGSTMSENFSLVSQVISGNSNGFATIVLNWGANPSDLDSHLTGPATTDRFHIFYANKIYLNDNNITGTFDPENPCATNNIVASLDRDDITSYGPETTTLCRPTAGGLYKYYIHHYAGSSTIGESSATVTLTLSNGTTRTFTPPSTGSTGGGDIWHVFNFDSDGNVYPVNQIIGNGSSSSPLMSLSILDTKFRAENNLFLKLPTK
jgi:hypothetical protein